MFFKYLSRQILFSRTFQDSPVYSSTFQACGNPDTIWSQGGDVDTPCKPGMAESRQVLSPASSSQLNETLIYQVCCLLIE